MSITAKITITVLLVLANPAIGFSVAGYVWRTY
jgi:hypothetical protein